MDMPLTGTTVKIEYSESNQDAAIKPPDFDSQSNQVHKVISNLSQNPRRC